MAFHLAGKPIARLCVVVSLCLCVCICVFVRYLSSHFARQPIVGLALPLVSLVPLTHIVFHLQHDDHHGDVREDGDDDGGEGITCK